MKQKIAQITKILKDCSYEDTAYIIKQVRDTLNLTRMKRNTIVQPLTTEDFGKILATAYNLKSQRGLIVKMLFLTGVRANEFVNLKIEHFDYNGKKIFVDVAKKESQRHIPLLPNLADELRTFIGDRKQGIIFQSQKPNKRNKDYKYTPQRIWQIVKEVAEIAKVSTEHKKVYPHKLRHTIATFLLGKGMPIEEIQKFLGHKSIATTQIYAKTDITKLQRDYNNVFGIENRSLLK